MLLFFNNIAEITCGPTRHKNNSRADLFFFVALGPTIFFQLLLALCDTANAVWTDIVIVFNIQCYQMTGLRVSLNPSLASLRCSSNKLP